MKTINNSVYIPSIDAKDLYLSNYFVNSDNKGYSLRLKNGEFSYNKFVNTLDYSLDLIKLREVYYKVYRRMDFSFWANQKEYTKHVVNVTFQYAVKEFNKLAKNTYVKNGYDLRKLEFTDCVCVMDGELIAIKVEQPVSENILSREMLGKYFYYDEGTYKAKTNITTVNSVADLRGILYKDGFVMDGIKYVRFKRSAGSSRVGKCLFINENLYHHMHKWEMCGIKIKDGQEVDLAALESYISLTLSSIIDTIDIESKNILVVDDYESIFTDKAAATDLNEKGALETSIRDVQISNSIWDGQSLIDPSLMGKYSCYGMVLLRQQFFKSCCFNCNIQKWFRDNGITKVEQLNGYTLASKIEDVKLITTPSSIKYLKFGKLDEWLFKIDTAFGVVKHEKPTHFFGGKLVQTHYQLLNTLPLSQDEVNELLGESFDFLRELKTRPSVVKYHIKYNNTSPIGSEPMLSRSDAVYNLLNLNGNFYNTGMYRDWLSDLLQSITSDLRRGKVLVNGNYSTMLGNPIEMLQQSIGKFSGESQMGVGNIYSKRFSPDEEVLGSRSPHVTMGNILIAHNSSNEMIDTYINTTPEIVCINSINENILERLSGSDFDSDTVMLTNNQVLLNAAKRIYDLFPVPTRLIKAQKTRKKYTAEDKTDLDIKTSVNKIGEIINLSQEINSYFWSRANAGEPIESLMSIYCDIATLDVMSNMEIDKAKKLLPVDNVSELKKLKRKYTFRDENEVVIKPQFFKPLAVKKGYYIEGKKNYKAYDTSMDYLQKAISKFRLPRYTTPKIKFSDIIHFDDYDTKRVWYEQAGIIFDSIRKTNAKVRYIWQDNSRDVDTQAKFILSSAARDECYRYINSLEINRHTMFYILKQIEKPEMRDVKQSLMRIFFSTPNQNFCSLINESYRQTPVLREISNGNISIYGIKYVEMDLKTA